MRFVFSYISYTPNFTMFSQMNYSQMNYSLLHFIKPTFDHDKYLTLIICRNKRFLAIERSWLHKVYIHLKCLMKFSLVIILHLHTNSFIFSFFRNLILSSAKEEWVNETFYPSHNFIFFYLIFIFNALVFKQEKLERPKKLILRTTQSYA